MSENLLSTALDTKPYKHWVRREALRSTAEALMGEQKNGQVDYIINIPPGIVYHFISESTLGRFLVSPGDSLIEGLGEMNETGDQKVLTLSDLLTVKSVPDCAFLRARFNYADPDEQKDVSDPDRVLWSCSTGVVFLYRYPGGTSGIQEVGIALLSNGEAGVYDLRAGFAPNDTEFYTRDAAFTVSARDLDATNKNVRALAALVGEPIPR